MITKKRLADDLGSLLAPYAGSVEADLHRWLVEDGCPDELAEAMRYCVLGGGKRLRPALVYMAAGAVASTTAAQGPIGDELTSRAAAAVEMVHCYSLAHDDLPAMDDDVLRRGRPSAHVRFGEAMAILAGDALLTRAFGVLAESADGRSGLLVAELARGAGAEGMIAGQVADMNLCRLPPGLEGLRFIHSRKTGSLIRSAVRMGAICGRADARQLAAMAAYGETLGLTFQLIDDLLDVTGRAQELGKTPGKDHQAGKRTYVSELGLDGARKLAAELTAQAIESLEPLGAKADVPRKLAELLAERTY